MLNIPAFIRHRPLLAYFILAYVITWSLWGLMILFSWDIKSLPGNILSPLAIFGPTLAGIIMTASLYGKGGLSDLATRFSFSSRQIRWFAMALLIPFFIIVMAIVISTLMGSSIPANLGIAIWMAPLLVEFVRVLFLGGPLGEEIGWRGFALPRLLLGNMTAMKASMVLGLIWGLWHAPFYAVAGSGQNDMIQAGGSFFMLFPAFVIWVMAMTVIFTWLHKITNGNLWIAILFHTAINTAAFFPSVIGVQSGMVPMLNAGLTWVVAILVSRTKIFLDTSSAPKG